MLNIDFPPPYDSLTSEMSMINLHNLVGVILWAFVAFVLYFGYFFFQYSNVPLVRIGAVVGTIVAAIYLLYIIFRKEPRDAYQR